MAKYTGISIEDRHKKTKVGSRWMAKVRDKRAHAYIRKAFADRHDEQGRMIPGSGLADAKAWANHLRARLELREAGAGRWPIDDVIKSYMEQLKTDRTSEVYQQSVRNAANLLASVGVGDLNDDSLPAKISKYLALPLAKNRRRTDSPEPAPATVRQRLTVVRAMVGHAMRSMGMRTDPLAGFLAPAFARPGAVARTSEQTTYGLEEVRAVLALERWADPVWVAWFIAIHTGLRAHEIHALTWADIDWQTSTLRVVRGKGGKPRTVPLTWSDEFLAAMSRLGGPKAKCPRLGKVCDLGGYARLEVEAHLRPLLDDADVKWDKGVSANGLPYRLGWHSCRRTVAAAYLAAGGDSLELQRSLGHEDISLTGAYAGAFTRWKHQVEAEGWPRGKLCFLRAPGVAVVPKAGG